VIDFDALVVAPCMAVFGENPDQLPVFKRVATGATFPIDGVFDDTFANLVVVGRDGDPEIASAEPVLGVRLAQFGGLDPVQNDQVTIPRDGKTYVVSSVEPDGKGWCFLRLMPIA
jgi:hypothetical protein